MPVTITASGNSTPPANTVIATRQVGSQEYQQFILADNAGSALGQAPASGLHVSVANRAGSAAGSPLFVSACITNLAGSAAGSPLFVTQNNMAGSAAGSPIFSSITNLAGSAAGSPLFVSACVTNLAGSAAGSPLFASITNGVSASLSGGSVALLAGANTIGAASAVQGAPQTNLANAWPMKLTDGTDTVGINAASQLLVAVNAASVTIVDTAGNQYGISAASPLYITGGAAGGTSGTDKSTYAEGTTSFTPVGGFFSTTTVALTASQAGAVRMTAQRALHARLSDESGNVLGVTGSPLIVSGGAGGTSATDKAVYAEGTTSFTPVGGLFSTTAVTLTASQSGAVLMTANRALHANLRDGSGNALGNAAASPLFTAASAVIVSAVACPVFTSVTNLAGSAAGSPLFTSVTNGVSASISGGSVALLAGANTIGVASVIQSGAWAVTASIANSPSVVVVSALASPVFVSVTNQAGSAAGSPLFVTQNNMAGSAAGSPIFSSITNLAGSAAGSPLFVRVGDGVDTAFVDAASRLAVAITDGTNVYGVAGSPLPVVSVANQVYWGGSLLDVNSVDLSASSSGCTRIVASGAGQAIVIVSATFTTSSCQFIGWVASGAGAASARVQTPMPFGTNGGMDANRLPHGHLWTFPSGSNAVLTTTSACNVAGTIDYLMVAS